MMISVALYIGSYEGQDAGVRMGLRWLAIALTVPVVGWCAIPFWKGALASRAPAPSGWRRPRP